MKSFLIKIISAVLVLSAVVFGLNQLYIFMEQSDSEDTKKFENVPDKIEICNLGSSHGLYGFCYDDIEDKYVCFNFALSAQSLAYDRKILEYYQDNLAEGAIVYIPVSYFSFFGGPENEEAGFEEKNQRYYNFLPDSLITDFDPVEKWLKKHPVLTAYEDIVNVFSGKRSAKKTDWLAQTAKDIDLKEDAKEAYKRHILNYETADNGGRIVNHENIDAVYDIIELCNAIGARPVLVTTPYLREYTEEIRKGSPGFFADFDEIMDKILSETNVEYYDYSCDSRFVDDYDLFVNADHLNQRGALLFVDILVEKTIE